MADIMNLNLLTRYMINIGDVINVIKHTNIYNHTDATKTGTYVFLKNLRNNELIQNMIQLKCSFYINDLRYGWSCSFSIKY